MEKEFVIELMLFLSGLTFGFAFGLTRDRPEDSPSPFRKIPEPPSAEPPEPPTPPEHRVIYDDDRLAKAQRAKSKKI